jgi:hypothetical protein
LCCSISIFSIQREHSFQEQSLSDTISWRSDHGIFGKAGKVMKWWIVCSLESSLPLYEPNLHWSNSPISVPLNHSWRSPYTSQSWWSMSASFVFLSHTFIFVTFRTCFITMVTVKVYSLWSRFQCVSYGRKKLTRMQPHAWKSKIRKFSKFSTPVLTC